MTVQHTHIIGRTGMQPLDPAPSSLAWRKRVVRYCLRGVIFLLVLEVTSLLIIPLANGLLTEKICTVQAIYNQQSMHIAELIDEEHPQLHRIDAVLGWRYAANYKEHTHCGVVQLNAAGLRSDREYAATPPPGILRIAAFGDSFVFGSEVGNKDAWPAIIERDNRAIEVLNYGVPGWGTDQAYLRYLLEGTGYSPHVVIVGFPPHALSRAVNVYRRFFSHADAPLFKPRFLLGPEGELTLVECPVRDRKDYQVILDYPSAVTQFGKNDQWYCPLVYANPVHDYSATVRLMSAAGTRLWRRYVHKDRLIRGGVFNSRSSAFKIQCAVCEAFVEAIRAAGAQPLIVIFADRKGVQAKRRGKERLVYDPLMEHLRARGIDFVDAAEAFGGLAGQVCESEWFAPDGHYSPAGNRIVAAWLNEQIGKRCQVAMPGSASEGACTARVGDGPADP